MYSVSWIQQKSYLIVVSVNFYLFHASYFNRHCYIETDCGWVVLRGSRYHRPTLQLCQCAPLSLSKRQKDLLCCVMTYSCANQLCIGQLACQIVKSDQLEKEVESGDSRINRLKCCSSKCPSLEGDRLLPKTNSVCTVKCTGYTLQALHVFSTLTTEGHTDSKHEASNTLNEVSLIIVFKSESFKKFSK